jgi:hypothetical protein
VLKPGQLEVLNQFAMAFSYAGERSAARDLFRRIRRRTTEYPWSYVTGLARPVYWNRRTQALLIP